jgi:D-alanyl-D-alanine dipeptidase
LIFTFCSSPDLKSIDENKYKAKTDTLKIEIKKAEEVIIRDTSDIEKIFINAGLVNIQELDSNIKVNIRYATTNNFVGISMYGDFNQAYLQQEVAEKLLNAQLYLKDTFPNYNLLIWDATRPLSIQQMMWDSVKVPKKDKPKYLSNPKYGSIHCFGAAVDLTIVNEKNKTIDMGTDFDSFKEIAYPILEERFLKEGKLSQEVINNRKLLRYVMEKAGFFNIQTEWWHFNSCYRKVARKKYAMLTTHILPKEEIYIAELTETELEKEEKIEDKSNIVFRVQIKTSTRKISVNDKMFKGLDIYRYYHEGLYKFTVGEFNSLEQAHELQHKILNKGYNGSFVAGFNNGKRIGIKSAIELLH